MCFLIVVIIHRWTISRVFIFVKGEMNVPAGTPLTNLSTLPYMLISGWWPHPAGGADHKDIFSIILPYNPSFICSLWEGATATKEHSYHKEVHNEVLHHQLIIVENLTPVLSPQERENRKQEINKSLYEVFKKYQDSNKSNHSWLRGLPLILVSSSFPY